MVAHGEDVVDELLEELAARCLLVDRTDGLAGGDDLVQVEPARNQLLAGVAEEAAEERRLGAHEEGALSGVSGAVASFTGSRGLRGLQMRREPRSEARALMRSGLRRSSTSKRGGGCSLEDERSGTYPRRT